MLPSNGDDSGLEVVFGDEAVGSAVIIGDLFE